MNTTRAVRLTLLRFQVRSLQQHERRLRLLHDKPCEGNRAEAAEALVRVRGHIEQAERELADALCLQEPHKVTSSRQDYETNAREFEMRSASQKNVVNGGAWP